MANGAPVIGEVVLSPHDKYSENDVAKYDQLNLSSSLVINQDLYPILYSKFSFSEIGRRLCIMGRFTESLVDTRSDYNYVDSGYYDTDYGETYLLGIGVFDATYGITSEVSVEETFTPCSAILNDYMEVISEASNTDTAYLSYYIKFYRDGVVLLTLKCTDSNQDDAELSYSLDEVSFTEIPLALDFGYIVKFNLHFDNSEIRLNWDSVDYLILPIEILDTDEFSLSCISSGVNDTTSGVRIVTYSSKKEIQSVASIGTMTPYRIVADLTEGG